MEKSALELLKEYRNMVEGRFDVNVKGMPQFTMVDRSDLYAFLGKRGFVDVTEERENDVVTYISKILSLKIHLYTDDDFWTIEDTNQPDDILEDGTGVQQLKQAVMVLFKAAKGIHESATHLGVGDKVKILGFWKSLQLPRSKHVGETGTITKRHQGTWNNRAGEYGAGKWFDVTFEDGSKELLGITQLEYVSGPEEQLKMKSGKFNVCYDCDGNGCETCDYTGKYAVGLNAHHYD